jgi:DNA-binding IclR family transcriptional regulator
MSELTPSVGPSQRRMRLPQRRAHDLLDVEHAGHRYTAGLGYFETGLLAEVFINVPRKSGTAIEAVARDAAILTSLCLQHGASTETIRHSLTRNSDGTASGPLGVILDLIASAPARRNP